MGRKPLNEADTNPRIAQQNTENSAVSPAYIAKDGWSKPEINPELERIALGAARSNGYIKKETRTARLRGKKDERQGSSKNLQIRTFEKQEEVLDWIQQTYKLKSRKETFDALLAIALQWGSEGRSIEDGMMQHFIANNFTLDTEE